MPGRVQHASWDPTCRDPYCQAIVLNSGCIWIHWPAAAWAAGSLGVLLAVAQATTTDDVGDGRLRATERAGCTPSDGLFEVMCVSLFNVGLRLTVRSIPGAGQHVNRARRLKEHAKRLVN